VLDAIQQSNKSKRPPRVSKPKPAPLTPEQVQAHQVKFNTMYERWLLGQEMEVQNELEKLDVEELRRFADSNNLNVTSKMPQQKLLHLIGARFREKKQLHKPPSSRSENS
jgi:hypothetical protein